MEIEKKEKEKRGNDKEEKREQRTTAIPRKEIKTGIKQEIRYE